MSVDGERSVAGADVCAQCRVDPAAENHGGENGGEGQQNGEPGGPVGEPDGCGRTDGSDHKEPKGNPHRPGAWTGLGRAYPDPGDAPVEGAEDTEISMEATAHSTI